MSWKDDKNYYFAAPKTDFSIRDYFDSSSSSAFDSSRSSNSLLNYRPQRDFDEMFDKIVGDVQPTNGGGFNVSNGNGWLNVL
jgi:hypothetical protein